MGSYPGYEAGSSCNPTCTQPIDCGGENIVLYTTITDHGQTLRACRLCNYTTTVIGNIEKHVRTHSGDKPFSCPMCPYKAIQVNNLNSHIRTHTGEKPFACKLCPYKASRSTTLNAHIARRHTLPARGKIT